ncbi:MAG: HAD hydrolase-like protein [Burkholderiales bacterium]|jgi:phosphoglycolate phosphatase|nr:HAD hydrolase-like protein [Burkholderiales bacterium]
MSVRLAIFDFDGTLADSWAVFAQSVNTLAVRHRFRTIGAGEHERLRRLGASQVLRELRLPLWRVPAVAMDLRRIVSGRIAEVKPFEGVPQALRQLLDAGIDLAIASSNTEDNVRAVLGDDLVARMRALECGTGLFGKPQRLRRILRHTACTPAEAVYVGDELRDAEAAREAGMAFCAVTWGYNDAGTLRGADPAHVFATPADFARLAAA